MNTSGPFGPIRLFGKVMFNLILLHLALFQSTSSSTNDIFSNFKTTAHAQCTLIQLFITNSNGLALLSLLARH